VADERMTVTEAFAAWTDRKQKTADRRRDSTALLNRVISLIGPSEQNDLEIYAADWAADLDTDEETLPQLERAIDTLIALRKALT
jgi:hypothetical protein